MARTPGPRPLDLLGAALDNIIDSFIEERGLTNAEVTGLLFMMASERAQLAFDDRFDLFDDADTDLEIWEDDVEDPDDDEPWKRGESYGESL